MKKLYYLYNGRSSLNFLLSNLNLKNKDEILYPNFSCDVIFQYSKKKNGRTERNCGKINGGVFYNSFKRC